MLRCSACNTLNPSDHSFCGYCGSRLAAPSGNGQPLPAWLGDNNDGAPTDPQPADAALPPWLATPATDSANITQPIGTTQADQDAAHEPAGAPIQDAVQASAADDASSLPPWLSSAPAAPTNDVPDWLHTEVPDPPRATNITATPTHAPQPPTASDNGLPDWLFDVDSASDNLPVLPEQASPAANTATDPFSSLPPAAGDTSTPPAGRESLDWLLNPPQAAEPASAVPPATDTLPDWLRDDVFDSATEVQSSPPTTQAGLPSWLRDEVPTMPTTQRSVTSVVDMQQDQFPSTAAALNNTSDDLPAWLRDDAFALPSDQGRTTMPLPIDELVADTNNGVALHNDKQEQEAIPAWLRDDPGTALRAIPTPVAEASALSSSEQADVPVWLRDDPTTATIETAPQADPMALPIAESEPVVAANVQGNTTAAESKLQPATTARVYDAADNVADAPASLVVGDAPQPEPALASSAGSLPEPVAVARPTVYDAPEPEPAPPATEDDILAAITRPAATPVATPATPVAAPATPVVSPATPASIPSPERTRTMSPPPRRQRSNGLWIMLIVVLVLAILAVGWLALRFNGIL